MDIRNRVAEQSQNIPYAKHDMAITRTDKPPGWVHMWTEEYK